MYLPQVGCKTSTHQCTPPPAAHRSGCVHSRARQSPGAWRQGTRAAPPRGPAGRSGRRGSAGRSPFVRAWLDGAPARPCSMHLWLLPAGTFHPCYHLSPAAPAPPPTRPGAPSRRGMWRADPPGTRSATAGPCPPAGVLFQSGFGPDQESRSREGRHLAWRYPCRSGGGQLLAPRTSLTRSGCRYVQAISFRTPNWRLSLVGVGPSHLLPPGMRPSPAPTADRQTSFRGSQLKPGLRRGNASVPSAPATPLDFVPLAPDR